MIARRANFTLATCTDHVARAVQIAAEEGTPSVNPFLLIGFDWIEALIWSLRIASDLTRRVQACVVVGAIPVAYPFPNVASHVVETKGVWCVLFGWGYSDEPIKPRIAFRDGEAALVDVRLVFSIDLDLVSPSVEFTCATSAGGEFPLGFGG